MILVAALLLLAESKVQLSQAPLPVQKTVAEQMKSSSYVGLTKEKEGGKTVYELETRDNDLTRDILIAADGTILVVEQEIKIADAPAAVQAAIQKQPGKLLKIETLTRNGKVTYEAQMDIYKRKLIELKFAADGTPVK